MATTKSKNEPSPEQVFAAMPPVRETTIRHFGPCLMLVAEMESPLRLVPGEGQTQREAESLLAWLRSTPSGVDFLTTWSNCSAGQDGLSDITTRARLEAHERSLRES
jgi:hypothetical protein